MKAVALIRVSTEDQDLGAQAQRAQIERWAASTGHEVVSWHEERVSGGADLDKREGLIDALVAVEEYKADALVVAKMDRIARSVLNYLHIEERIKRLGATLVCASGEGAGTGPEATLMRTIIAAVAEWERMTIAMRTRAALSVLRGQGKRVGSIPVGFTVGEDGKTLEVDENESEAVRLAVDWYSRGMTPTRIGIELSYDGFKTRNGKPYHCKQVQRMINNARPKSQPAG